nr:MAG TPA: tail tape measure protein [Caudoviricetes sp.]
MANETKISTIVSKSAFDQLERLDALINKASDSYLVAAKNMAKGLSFDPKSVSELIEKNNQYMSSLKEIQKAETEINRLRQEKNKAIQDGVNEIMAQIKADQEAARIAKEKAKLEKEQSKVSKELAAAERIRQQAAESLSRAKLAEEKATISASKADKLHAQNLRLTSDQVEELILKLDTANLSYKEQASILSQLKAYSKTQVGGVGAVDPKVLENIQKLDKLLKEQDAKMGIYGRNVGNYASHWDGLGNAINQLSREMPAFAVSMQTGLLAISNNLPILADEIARIKRENVELTQSGQKAVPVWRQVVGSLVSWQTLLSVGVTLLTVYGAKIFDFAADLLKSKDASKAASDALEDLNSTSGDFFDELKNATSTYGKNVTSIRTLQEEWNRLGDDLDKKKQFIIDNESEFKKLDVSITNVNEAENFLVTHTDDFLEALKQRAKYAAASKLAAEKYAEALELEAKAEIRKNNPTWLDKINPNKTIIPTTSSMSALNAQMVLYNDTTTTAKANAEKAAEGIMEQAKSAKTAADIYVNAMSEALKEENKTLEDAGIDKYSNKEKAKGEEEKAKREAARRMKLEMEAERTIQEARIKLMDEGFEKEKATRNAQYQKRIDDVKTKGVRVNEQIAAIEAEREKDLADFREEYESKRAMIDAQNRISYAQKGSLQELDARLDILELQKKAELKEAEKSGADKLTVENKYLKLIEDAYLEFGKAQLSRQQSQDELESSEQQISLNKELSMLEQQYSKGLIKKEAYEKKKADLQYQYATQALQKEIDLLESSLYLFSGDERLEMEKKIAQLRVQLSKTTTDKINADAERELKERQKVEEAKKKLVQEVSEAIGKIGSAIFERRIQNVEAEIDANQEAYDKQVEEIEALAEKDIITKEEAEARKRVAEEQTSARNAELEKKKADLQTRQARFQKTMDITQTIAATALAVTKALPNLVLAALVGAMGAAQLAAIIAQPIPKYAKGTDYHPGGLAIVGDAGKHEAIISGGKAYITPDTPTLMPIPKGAEVLPDIYDPEFYSRFMDNGYWLTHNKAGEKVQIVNNFDAEGIIQANNKTNDDLKREIRSLGRIISKGQRMAEYNSYKNSKLN